MFFIVVGALLLVVGIIGLVAVPRRRARSFIDVSEEPSGRRSIDEALWEAIDDFNAVANGDTVPHDEVAELRRELETLEAMVAKLARQQLSESDIFLYSVRALALIVAVFGGAVGLIALIVALQG